MKRILVPTDFSAEADNALEVACSIARKTGATIDLLHVIEPVSGGGFVSTGTFIPEDSTNKVFILKMMEKAKKELSKRMNHVRYAGVRIKDGVEVGDLFKIISEITENNEISLVVMGTKGINSFMQSFSGSNTEKVVRLPKCFVLSVKEKVDNFQIRNVVFPVDFEDEYYRFVYKLKQLQKVFDFRLHLVHVNTVIDTRSSAEINALFKEFVKNHELSDYETHVINDFPVESTLLDIAEKLKADMIAMVTHRRKGLSYFLKGSITEDLVNYSTKTILSYNIG